MVSIIVPVYNVRRYLKECLESILKQTYSDLQIILVDDGSTDGSGEVCNEYKERDQRVEVIHKPNGGLSDARNKGLEIARGEYVMFVDSDDFINQSMVEIMLKEIIEKQADVIDCDYYSFKEGRLTKSYYANNRKSYVKEYTSREALKLMMEFKINCSAWGKLYRRKVLTDVEFPYGRYNEDIIFNYYLYVGKNMKIIIIPDALYYYRVTPGSLTHVFSKKKFDVIRNALEIQSSIEYLNIKGLAEPAKKLVNICNCNVYVSLWRSKAMKEYPEEFRKIRQHIKINFFQIIFGDYYFKDKLKTLFAYIPWY